MAAHPQQIALRFGAFASPPRFNCALGQCFRPVGQREIIVDANDAAKAAAGRTSADGVVEAEKGRSSLTILEVACCAVETIAEWLDLWSGRLGVGTGRPD